MNDSDLEADQDDMYPEDDKENCNGLNEDDVPAESVVAKKETYMRLLQTIQDLKENDDTGPHVIKLIHNILQEVKSAESEFRLGNRINNIDESVLDANILNLAGDILTKCINALQAAASNYDPVEFTNHLRETLKKPNENEFKNTDILSLIKDARKIVTKPPRYGFLYGSFDPTTLPEPKQRKERKTRTQETKEKLKKKTPENVTNAKDDGQNADEIVSHQKKVLEEEFVNNGYRPINYYQFVIDTDSFSATVENMFYFSFLIANGTAALYIDENNHQPVIKPVSKKLREKMQKEGGVNVQMIANICEDEWKTFEIGTGLLQQRRLQSLNT